MKCKFARNNGRGEWADIECSIIGTYPTFELSITYDPKDQKTFMLNDGNIYTDVTLKSIKIHATKFWFDCTFRSKVFVIEGIAEIDGKFFRENFHLTVL